MREIMQGAFVEGHAKKEEWIKNTQGGIMTRTPGGPLLVSLHIGAGGGRGLIDMDPVVGTASLLPVFGLPAAPERLGVRVVTGCVVHIL